MQYLFWFETFAFWTLKIIVVFRDLNVLHMWTVLVAVRISIINSPSFKCTPCYIGNHLKYFGGILLRA